MLYQQPQSGPLALDPANPATRGALLAVSYGVGSINAVTGKSPDVQAGIRTPGTGVFGVWDSAYGAGADDRHSLPSTRDFAFVAVVDYSGSPGGVSSILGGDAPGNRAFQFRFNASNQLEFIRFDTGGSPYFCTVAATSRKGVVVGVSIGNTFKVYFNGATATSTIGNTAQPATTISLGASLGNDSAPGTSDRLFTAAVLRGSAADPVAFSLLANPYQIFLDQDEEDEAAFFAATATGGAATYSYLAAGGIILSGASPIIRRASKSPSGGVQFSGATTRQQGATKIASGGILIAGSAAQACGKSVAVSGGLILAGAVIAMRGAVRTAAGGILFGGAATATASLSFRSAVISTIGGIVISGSSAIVRKCTRITSGGIQFAGTSAVEFFSTLSTGASDILGFIRRRGRR